MDPKRFTRYTEPLSPSKGGMETYKDFDATELYCPACKQAVPVRKRLLLVLPDGDKYEYLCAYCAGSVGTKIDRDNNPLTIIS
jgi:hypothetical protein